MTHSTVDARSPLPPGPEMPPSRLAARWMTRPLEFLQEMRERYGDVFTLRLPQEVPWVMVSEPDLTKPVLSAPPQTLHAGEANHALRPLMGPTSIMLLDEEEHVRQRRMLLPPFHAKRIARYGDVMREVAEAEIDRWPIGVAGPAWPRMQSIALEVILRTIFGAEDEDRLELLRAAVGAMLSYAPAGGDRAAFVALNAPGRLEQRRFADFRAAIAKARELVLEEVQRGREQSISAERADVFSMLLQARYEDGSEPSDVELRDQLVTLLIAGHETTAVALTWALERLVRHPAALERATADAAGGGGPYIDAVIKETLRLRPVAPVIVRRVRQPIELGDHVVRPDAAVVLNLLLLHRHPRLYPDPDAFEPERFLDRQPDPRGWLPFGGGIRRCIGAGLALHEMGIVLPTLLARVRPRAVREEPEGLRRRVITLAPSEGATVALEAI